MDFFWEVISEIAQIFRTGRFVLIYLLEQFPWLRTAESSSNRTCLRALVAMVSPQLALSAPHKAIGTQEPNNMKTSP